MNILANLGGLFGADGLLIFLIMLLFFGAKRLPELARGLGSAVREFSKAKDEIEHELTRPPAPQIKPPAETQPRIIASEETPAAVAAPPSHQEPQAHIVEVPSRSTPIAAQIPSAPASSPLA